MKPSEYRERALARSRPAQSFIDDLLLCGLGIAEEAGEVAGIAKKHRFHGKPFDLIHYVEEVGDVLWYADRALYIVGWTLEECLEHNDAKLAERYPDGFKRADQ